MSPASDHQQICELVYRYALGIDTRDWALYRSIFADEVHIDFTSYSGGNAATMAADDWVTRARRLFTGLAATQHTMTNPIVRVDGDRATCTMYMQAVHVLDHGDDDAWFTIGGYYSDSFERRQGAWCVTGVTLTVLWRRGDSSIMRTALARGAGLGASAPTPD